MFSFFSCNFIFPLTLFSHIYHTFHPPFLSSFIPPIVPFFFLCMFLLFFLSFLLTCVLCCLFPFNIFPVIKILHHAQHGNKGSSCRFSTMTGNVVDFIWERSDMQIHTENHLLCCAENSHLVISHTRASTLNQINSVVHLLFLSISRAADKNSQISSTHKLRRKKISVFLFFEG